MGRAGKKEKEKEKKKKASEDVESVANDNDPSPPMNANTNSNSNPNTNMNGLSMEYDGLDGLDDGPSSSFYSPSTPQSPRKKKSCGPNCLNKSLLGLKALLFLFYGGKSL